MRKVLLSFLFVWMVYPFFAQSIAYKAEDDGYFSNSIETKAGLVLIGNKQNDLYLLKNNKLITLLSTPGCARYIQLSPDSLSIAFKYIHKDGSQQPAVLNLNSQQITFLYSKVPLCGQPTFDANGTIYFTVGNELNVYQNGNIQSFQLPLYVNYIAVSHNGNLVAFADDDKGIYLFNLTTLETKLIGTPACFYPAFSYNNRYLAYGSNPHLLYVYDLINDKTPGTY